MIASTLSPSILTSRRMPRSAIVRTGISGSCTEASAARARSRSACAAASRAVPSSVWRPSRSRIVLPCRARIGPLQVLELSKHMAEMLGVPPVSAARLHPAVARTRQGRLAEYAVDRRVKPALQRCRIDGDARSDEIALDLIRLEELARVGPFFRERFLHA